MFDFTYYTPTEVAFGRSALEKTGALAAKHGARKVLIHYGSERVVKNGLLGGITEQLQREGIEAIALGGVQPNPRLSKVYEGIRLGREENVDFLLAVGGGSVIDSSKAIAYGLVYDGDIWDFFLKNAVPSGALPVGVVLTIAASGSEMSNSCVISREETQEKRSLNNDLIRPKFAVMNPELTMTLPAYQTACGCVDILMHTEERYFTNGGNMELTDALAEGLMRTVLKNARILAEDPRNYDARAEVMWAGAMSHNGLTGCGNDGGDFACHGIEHELSALYDVAHGAGLAAIWPSWARYVYRDCLPRFRSFAMNVCGVPEVANSEETALAGIRAMEDFYHEIGMPINLAELGIRPTEGEMAVMARHCMEAAGGRKGSAKVLYEKDVLRILHAAAE